jgi:ATP-dependent Clp protease ATP-binding subunit ClpX
LGAEVQSKKDRNSGFYFHDVKPDDLMKFGLIPEFIGRLPVTVALDKLDTDALVKVLTEPKNAIIKQYQKMLKLDDVELIFEEDAVDAIADMAIEQNIGARGLRSIIEAAMRDVMFNIPSEKDVKQCIIKKETITERKPPILIYKNGSQEKNISEAASSGKALGVS